MTPYEIRTILELRKQGVAFEYIAGLIGRDVGKTRLAAHQNGVPGRVEFWTVAKVAQLRLLAFKDSMSAAEMGRELGCSRNAVIGKAQRLHIQLRKVNDGGVRSAPKMRQRRSKAVLQPVVRNEVVFDIPTEPTAETWVRLVDTKDKQCRWPVSEPSHDMLCCGDQVAHEGTRYCWHHYRISVSRPERMEDEYS